MKQVGWMAGAALLSWLLVETAIGAAARPEALYGMLGPLVVASVSWVVTERTYLANPERLTGVMVKGLAVKAMFFGVYVAGMLRIVDVRPVPFVLSFTGYFIAFYMMEALFMRRLFSRALARP